MIWSSRLAEARPVRRLANSSFKAATALSIRSRYFASTGFSTVAMMFAPSSCGGRPKSENLGGGLGDGREDPLAFHHFQQVPPLADREDHDRDMIVAHQGHR